MLGLAGVEDSRTRPMTAQVDVPEGGDKEDGGQIYFFASKSEHLVQALGQSHRAVATFAGKGHELFAHIHGTLVETNDRAVIDRLWNPIIASWYKDGKNDPDLALLRFDTDSAEYVEGRNRLDAQGRRAQGAVRHRSGQGTSRGKSGGRKAADDRLCC